ncbi:uncharacterized protein LOC132619869 [Lycium barbarum]|uniref:uncharacterized protein LOC132619869 n=1 Tax=Lycium barbarum TaxID=112863 RepID=UPI00293F1395|nr:uncharacterized protein LOC132619869 [Lycium barbarum]
MAFIKGRQIMDAVLIANECVESRQRSQKPGILCKLDIQKAYDHLNWNFLVQMLQKMGFGARWIRWIKQCISTVRFSVLINRTPNGFFPSQRGLRQGDLLSPFLFILAMEGLSNMIQTAKVKGWVRGFQVDNRLVNNLEVTHLQYADDTLVFCEAVEEQILVLRVIFIIFEAVSGLHINWGKSFIYPINEVTDLESLAEKLGGKVGELPTTYLHAFGSKKQRNEDKKKFHLVNWEEVTVNKKEGGVGIRDMKMQNRSLMMKWLWKFATTDNMLWKEVISAKYGIENSWMTNVVTIPYGCSVWRTIRNLWPLIINRSRFKVGNGLKFSFWDDKWIGHEPLKQLYPDLYTLCFQQQATVAELWTRQGWNLHLRRHLNDWEMERIAAFYSTVDQFNNLIGERDTMVWKIDNKCLFTVNSAYRDLNTSNNQELWKIFISLRKIKWVKPGSIKGVLSCWNRDGNAARQEERWKIVPACDGTISSLSIDLIELLDISMKFYVKEQIELHMTQCNESETSPDDIIGKLFGPEHSGRVSRLEYQLEGTLNALKTYMISKEGSVPDEFVGLFAPQPQPGNAESEPTSPVDVRGSSDGSNANDQENT